VRVGARLLTYNTRTADLFACRSAYLINRSASDEECCPAEPNPKEQPKVSLPRVVGQPLARRFSSLSVMPVPARPA
jgi:hypothetical protein